MSEGLTKNDSQVLISGGNIKIVWDARGLHIFWNNSELTTGEGLISLLRARGVTLFSNKASWSILNRADNSLRLRLVFDEILSNQSWDIKINEDNVIDWQVYLDVNDDSHVDEIELLCSISPNYKSWLASHKDGFFYDIRNELCDLGDAGLFDKFIGARFYSGEASLPPFIFEVSNRDYQALVKNSHSVPASNILGFKYKSFCSERKFYPGKYKIFSGRIKIFQEESLLDAKLGVLHDNNFAAAKSGKVISEMNKHDLKVLLVNLPWHVGGNWGVRAGSRWPHIKIIKEDSYMPFPFFLAQAASLLRRNSIEANVIDAIAECTSEEKITERISSIDFDLLVAEVSTPSFWEDLRMLKNISLLGKKIAVCGPHAQIYTEDFLRDYPFVDFVLCGEYEFTLLELAECLRSGNNDLSQVKGLIYRDNKKPVKNSARKLCDVNLLPWPARDCLPMEKYLDAPGGMPVPSAQMIASRGCPFQCIFCLWPQVMYQGRNYRTRDINDVMDEMEYLINHKGFKSIYFDDDTFNIGKARMFEFCREIKKRGLEKVPWAIMARPDLMDEEILREMKSAGLYAVKYGVESSNQHILEGMKKNMDIKKSVKMIRLTKDLGIKTHLTFTFGLPGETKKTIKETIDFALRMDPFSLQFSITTPFPDTEYFSILEKEKLIITKDWSKYDGNSGSVMKLHNLTGLDLELAQKMAYRMWDDHLRRKRGVRGDLKKFIEFYRKNGIWSSFIKTAGYLKYVFLKRRAYLSVNNDNALEPRRGFLTILKDKAVPKIFKWLRLYGLKFVLVKIWNFALRHKNKIDNRIMKTLPGKIMIKGADKYPEVDILLVLCPPWDITMPPLGIAYLSTYLKKKGLRPLVLDVNISLYNIINKEDRKWWHQNYYNAWSKEQDFLPLYQAFEDEFDEIANTMLSVKTKFIGFSINFANRLFTIELMKRIKKANENIKIIAGGFGCVTGHMRSLIPKDLIDVFVIGEGEETLYQIIERFNKGDNISDIPGVIVNERGVFSEFVPRKPILSLDSMPYPTFEEFNLAFYQSSTLPLLMSRGCIGHCSFCNDHKMSFPYRFKSAEYLFEEIKFHFDRYHITNFSFKDLLCNGNPRELEKFCDLVYGSGLKINWDSQAIPKKDLTRPLLMKMKRAGCCTLIYGVESLSNKILKVMGKYFMKEDVKQVLEDTFICGIQAYINIIVGFPGETEEDFMETYNFIKDNRKHISRIGALSTCLVNNDSDLEDNSQKYGLIFKDDHTVRAIAWEDNTGNNLAVRKERLAKIADLLKELGLGYECSSLLGELACENDKKKVDKKPGDEKKKYLIHHNLLSQEDVKEDSLNKELIMLGIKYGSKALRGPEIVQFDVTNRCNNNCLCCWNNSPLLEENAKTLEWRNKELPLDLINRTLDELKEMGTKMIFFAGGGEPFMHKDFLPILEKAKSNKMKVFINTNFTLVNEEALRKMVELRVDFLHVSLLAGNSDVYCEVHPNKITDDFLRIKELLVRLADLKHEYEAWNSPHVNIYYVIFNKNYHQIPPMVDVGLEVRANSVEFTPIDVIPGKTDKLLLNESQRQFVLRDMRKQKEKLKALQKKYKTPITFIEQADNFIKKVSSRKATKGEYEVNSRKIKRCYVGWMFSRIAADGNVYPCLKSDKIPVGNIYSSSFLEIWNDTKQRMFREKTIKFDLKDPYFLRIGNNNSKCGCLIACDNMQVNLELDKEFKQWIKGRNV